MRKIILSVAMLSLFMGVNAQQAEMEATEKAYKNKNYSLALSQAELADAKIKSDVTIEPETLAEFYFAAAKSAKESGNLIKAGEYFAKLNELESKPYYKTKNKDTRNWEYYYDKAEAEAVAAAGNYGRVKDDEISKSLMTEELPVLANEGGNALKKGQEAFNKKDYKTAGDEFLKAYYLYKAVGQDKPLYKYYSALGYVQSKENEAAVKIFQSLIDDGFTGVETNYLATDKDGKDVAFFSKSDMDTQVKLGLVTNPRVEQTASLEEDLYSNATYTYYQLENFAKAIEVGQKGLKKFPANDNMSKIVPAAYQKSGKLDDFITSLQAKVDGGTADAVDYFNLAKSLEDKDIATNIEKSKAYYKKSIELDPKFGDAYLNLGLLVISPEKEYVEIMNSNLGGTAKETKVYNEYKAKRKELYKEAVPFFEKAYEFNKENTMLIKILKNSYEVIGSDDKYMKFKKIYDALVK